MNEFETNLLSNNGFTKSISISRLINELTARQNLPLEKGVYVVVSEVPMEQDFLEIGSGGFFKGKDPNVSIIELRNNWVENSQILYIGLGGGYKPNGELKKATLQSRLNQLVRFGSGKKVGHWGGRLLWQLAFAKELKIYYRTCPDDEDPRKTEATLIKQYKEHYGKWPFANLKD